ncbi:DUF2059 domain-containing protein [Methylobacterium iners]|uniref:DUF2059 domain-containing protein n=1 Tax=Methylobacterium iners TaxID=418707 RepID=A0ABQ4S1N9_9HYPH|nr:DUF2059 domain-containing protein [Methylobacterium iners]GJD96322.1 hypothetical protein OCOJLMKI_3543 [Methylobacterium iners]
MRPLLTVTSLCLSAVMSCTALAQPAAAPKPSPGAAPSAAAPDPATLKAARDLVAQMQGDRTTVLAAMGAPMVGLIQQMGVKEADRAQVLVQDVVMPVLTSRYDELIDIQARSYAAALGKEDLQAIGVFYASPAGRRLVAAQPQLAQAQMTGMTQWMQSVTPEMQAKLVQAIQARGWSTGAQPKPR